jgi:hypothetical protein
MGYNDLFTNWRSYIQFLTYQIMHISGIIQYLSYSYLINAFINFLKQDVNQWWVYLSGNVLNITGQSRKKEVYVPGPESAAISLGPLLFTMSTMYKIWLNLSQRL